jgi:LPS-assembly lipoprotein
MMRSLLFSIVLLALTACGFRPLYADGNSGQVSSAMRGIRVAPIPDRVGQLVRDGLERQFTATGAARYQLVVTLEESIEGFGIRQDESTTRERVSTVARYALIDLATNQPVLEELARSDVGVDKVSSEYATIVAERAAAKRNADQLVRQITNRLAQYFQKSDFQKSDSQKPGAAAVP